MQGIIRQITQKNHYNPYEFEHESEESNNLRYDEKNRGFGWNYWNYGQKKSWVYKGLRRKGKFGDYFGY